MALQDFITHVRSVGFTTGAKYAIVAPAIGGGRNAEIVSMMCNTASLPGSGVMTTELRYFGEVSERPYGVFYTPVQLTFYLDNALSAKKYFDEWMKLIVNKDTRTFGYYDDFVKTVEIIVMDRNDNEIDRIKLHEAYPKTINDVGLDYSSNAPMVLSVNLVYKWWESSNDAQSDERTLVDRSRAPEYGIDGIGILRPETLGNMNFETFTGQGISMNPGSPGLFGISTIGKDLNSSALRGLTGAGNLFGISGVTTPGYPNMGDTLRNTTQAMARGISDFSGGLMSLGDTINEVTGPVATMSTAIGSIAGTIGAMDGLLTSLGVSNSGLGKLAGKMAQSGGFLGEVSRMNGIPGHLYSVGANMSQVGSIIGRSVGQMKAATPSFDKSAEIGMNDTATTLLSSAQGFNNAASSILEKFQ